MDSLHSGKRAVVVTDEKVFVAPVRRTPGVGIGVAATVSRAGGRDTSVQAVAGSTQGVGGQIFGWIGGGTMKRRTLILFYVGLIGAGLAGATQWVGYRLAYHPALGSGVRFGLIVLYPPWAMVGWIRFTVQRNAPKTPTAYKS